MLLTVRVAFTVLFCAVALSAQAPGATHDASSLSDPGELNRIAFTVSNERPAPETRDQFAFKLNLSTGTADGTTSASTGNPPSFPSAQATPQPPRPQSRTFTLSHGYMVRKRVHKYASIATLPLFASEMVVGEKLMNGTGGSDSLRSVHSALAAGIGVLFGVESVTGIWNLWEGRNLPHGRGKRLFHGILMLSADAGFVATAALAPGGDDRRAVDSSRASTHRTVAYASMGVAAFSYLYMLFAR